MVERVSRSMCGLKTRIRVRTAAAYNKPLPNEYIEVSARLDPGRFCPPESRRLLRSSGGYVHAGPGDSRVWADVRRVRSPCACDRILAPVPRGVRHVGRRPEGRQYVVSGNFPGTACRGVGPATGTDSRLVNRRHAEQTRRNAHRWERMYEGLGGNRDDRGRAHGRGPEHSGSPVHQRDSGRGSENSAMRSKPAAVTQPSGGSARSFVTVDERKRAQCAMNRVAGP